MFHKILFFVLFLFLASYIILALYVEPSNRPPNNAAAAPSDENMSIHLTKKMLRHATLRYLKKPILMGGAGSIGGDSFFSATCCSRTCNSLYGTCPQPHFLLPLFFCFQMALSFLLDFFGIVFILFFVAHHYNQTHGNGIKIVWGCVRRWGAKNIQDLVLQFSFLIKAGIYLILGLLILACMFVGC